MHVVRPGIDPKWPKVWKRQHKFNLGSIQNMDLKNIERLEYYAKHGITIQRSEYTDESAYPPSWNWESFLPSELATYGSYRMLELQERSALSLGWDIDLAARSFASIYTSEMIELLTHFLFPRRFPGRILDMMGMRMLPNTALGLIFGATDQALRLARLQASAYRKGYYFAKPFYPIFTFILRVLVDYLGDAPLPIEGESAKEPIFNALFDLWREPDPTALTEVCLAACDFHTHRCRTGKRDAFHEFDNGGWMLIPIEILLLFKLRQRIGLENPQLDHPLMGGAFGTLPPEVG